ncbi:MAG: hypothetical protein ACXW04_01180 [Methylobacter sp.]
MKAIEIFLSHYDGNQSKAARAIGTKQGNVWYWLKKSDLPLELIPKAAELIGKKPKDLRPDIFK